MIQLDQRFIILVLTSLVNVVLGLVVWRNNRTHEVNQRFATYSVAVAAWGLSNALVNTYAASPHGIVWARAAFLSASIIPLSFFLFVSVFPTPTPSPSTLLTRVFLISALTVAGLSTTPLIARSTSSLDGVLRVA